VRDCGDGNVVAIYCDSPHLVPRHDRSLSRDDALANEMTLELVARGRRGAVAAAASKMRHDGHPPGLRTVEGSTKESNRLAPRPTFHALVSFLFLRKRTD
jgi:hypothetical protein